MSQNFYTFHDNSFGTRGAPWMGSGYTTTFTRHACRICGNYWEEPKGVISLNPQVEKGSFWPDALGTGGGQMGLYVTEKVKKVWDNEKIRYGRGYLAKVLEPYPKKMRDLIPPNYYWIGTPKGIQIDYEASGFREVWECPQCGFFKFREASPHQPMVFVPGSWNGFDVFGMFPYGAALFCTQKIVDLAIEHRWTNFWFSLLDAPPGLGSIPYLRLPKKSKS